MNHIIKLIVIIFCLNVSQSYSQQITYSGDVRDINTHEKISNVNITVKNSQIGTTTNAIGKFSLTIPTPFSDMTIVFQHIGYEIYELKPGSTRNLKTIYLQPRVIPLRALEVEAKQDERNVIRNDLPQAVTVMRGENFISRGFIDAADLLSTDQSIQVDEELSGKKSISIRGGNPDDVLILYNGIKMNSAYDNTFDLSLIDLEDVEQVEVIRGSQTSVLGAGGFTGVVNIVPRVERDYLLKFQQRVGTYNSGNWGLSFYKNLNDVHTAYSYKKGGTTRQLSNYFGNEKENLINESTHHTANIDYRFNDNLLSGSFTRTNLGYDNQRDHENIENLDQLASLKYDGNIYSFSDFNLTASVHQYQEDQQINRVERFRRQFLLRNIENESYYYTVNKKWSFSKTELFLSYQLEDAWLNFDNSNYDPNEDETTKYTETMTRQHHGFVTVAKLFNQLDSLNAPVLDMDFCLRSDYLNDSRKIDKVSVDKSWNKTTLKFSSNMKGRSDYLVYHAYINYGKNIKFPTMLQQTSVAQRWIQSNDTTRLKPEISNGYDIGFELTGEILSYSTSGLQGWQLSFNLFKNYFTDKLRSSYTPESPLAFYDNVTACEIGGFEAKSSLYFLNKKVTLGFGFSHHNISDKAAFPFKYDKKLTTELRINHKGYNFHLYTFYEGEQVGWIRSFQDDFSTETLPSHFNMDVHLKKNFEINKFKFLLNASIRNLINEDVELVGLALRDRRYYLTFGVSY